MAGGFKASRLGALLDSLRPGKRLEHLQKIMSLGLQWQRLVNDRYYDVTMGALLKKKEAEAMALLRNRKRKELITDDCLNGRLEILEEIQEEIKTRIRTGQEAQIVLEKQKEDQNVRRKQAS